jgi:hypothetical protein
MFLMFADPLTFLKDGVSAIHGKSHLRQVHAVANLSLHFKGGEITAEAVNPTY